MTETTAVLDPRSGEPGADERFTLADAARILEVPEPQVRAFARAGLLAPPRGPVGPLTFGFQDLVLLRTTRDLVASGVPMRRVRQVWSSLRGQLASDVPLTSVAIKLEGEEVLASDGRVVWRADSGQFLLDLEAKADDGVPGSAGPADAVSEIGAAEPPMSDMLTAVARAPVDDAGPVRPLMVLDAPPIPGVTDDAGLPDPCGPRDAGPSSEQWYETGLELERSAPAEAIRAYEHALERNPAMADAHVNLGRLYHAAGERGRAEAHYRDAVRLAPGDPTSHFNLGVLLEEQGRREEAVLAYGQALARDPDFADAHCNLGLLLESLGRRQDAMRHLMAARELYRSE